MGNEGGKETKVAKTGALVNAHFLALKASTLAFSLDVVANKCFGRNGDEGS